MPQSAALSPASPPATLAVAGSDPRWFCRLDRTGRINGLDRCTGGSRRLRVGKQVDDQVGQQNRAGQAALPSGAQSQAGCLALQAVEFGLGDVRVVGLRQRRQGGETDRRPERRCNDLACI